MVAEGCVLAGEQSGVVTPGPWVARDGFVADTAVRLDRLQAKLERLEHQGELVKHHMAELMDNAHQANRLQAFEESLRNSREYKIDELLRSVKDVKGRLDQIEGGRATFNGLSYKSFEAIDKKLAELHVFQSRVETVQRNVKLAAALFCGSVLLVAAELVTRFA
jgi:phage shock protein A